ncbi:MAG: phage holin family protein [Paludibacter sp.]
MPNHQEPTDNFQQLYSEVKKYIELQTEYVKVEFVEKLTILLSTLLIIAVVLILAITGLFYLFFAIAYALEPILGSLAMSFGIISVLYLVLIFIFYLFRNQLVINPLVKLLSNLFLTKKNK